VCELHGDLDKAQSNLRLLIHSATVALEEADPLVLSVLMLYIAIPYRISLARINIYARKYGAIILREFPSFFKRQLIRNSA
jgi:hypothetical protein